MIAHKRSTVVCLLVNVERLKSFVKAFHKWTILFFEPLFQLSFLLFDFCLLKIDVAHVIFVTESEKRALILLKKSGL